MDDRPTSPDEFAVWSSETTCGVFDSSTATWYQVSQNNLLLQLQEMPFFTGLDEELSAIAARYHAQTSSQLFAHRRSPETEWSKKPYASFIEKLYRLNCVENGSFPNPPPGGWAFWALVAWMAPAGRSPGISSCRIARPT
jgi:hypothetical protein